jgi:hypothetical protein
MRRLALLILPLLAACNANPLLTAAASDYAPVKVGQVWTYAQPGSPTPYVRTVSAQVAWNGRSAYQVDDTGGGAPTTEYWSFQGGDWYQWDPTLGWLIYRRLPYVTGNSWNTPTTDPVNIVTITYVDGLENVGLANAYYGNCFKLRRETSTYSGGVTTTTDTISWVAAGIGDVKVASIDNLGTLTVLGELSSYQAP